ncbi:MAG: glycosyltransferase family 4 protein [Rhodothermales bacterium]|nr:glycosyltransferase family 4 protein [Rhodothermales bacterium]
MELVHEIEPATAAPPVRRVAFLFTRLSGYIAACLKTLKERHGVELLVVRQPPAQEAPFAAAYFDWIDALHDRRALGPAELDDVLRRFDPQAVYLSGWSDRGYLQVARRLRKRGAVVVAGSDTQWSGSLRQQVGRLIAPVYLHPAIDALWVPGERQRWLAAKLGFTGERCWEGVYACDWARFAEAYHRTRGDRPRAFLFVGRYVPVKGLDVLTDAYRIYRTRVSRPWPLLCAGAGAYKPLLAEQDGIVDMGFVQPDALAGLMERASAFVLPSKREPWGVVVQEAAASGLPVLCSEACGAAVHLLRDGYNGFLFETGNAAHLAQGMVRVSEASDEQWAAMSLHSHLLSKQFTPQRWADTLVSGVQALRPKTG